MAAAFALAVVFAMPVSAQATLATDINSGPGDSNPHSFTEVGTLIYFSADEGMSGTELWSYDPSTGTATLAADINPGPSSSHLHSIAEVGGVLYFSADDGASGTELWSYDPANGTAVLAANIRPGGLSSFPEGLTEAGGVLYFSADDGVSGKEVWSYLLAPPTALSDGLETARNEPVAAPNPFRQLSEIRFALAEAAEVDLRVFDALGREVAVLATGVRQPGMHAETFRAGDLPSGVYVWRLSIGGEVTTGHVTLAR